MVVIEDVKKKRLRAHTPRLQAPHFLKISQNQPICIDYWSSISMMIRKHPQIGHDVNQIEVFFAKCGQLIKIILRCIHN